MPSLEIELVRYLMYTHAPIDYKYFIETGTNSAYTTLTMAPYFEKVYTIELSDDYYQRNVKNYANTYPNVHFLKGDSSVVLNDILPGIDHPSIFFLDGHWSSGDTAKGSKDCPLIEEVDAIQRLMKHPAIIIIDDYRLFGKGPMDNTCVQDWHSITKEKILGVLKDRVLHEYHLPSHLHHQDRWIIVITQL